MAIEKIKNFLLTLIENRKLYLKIRYQNRHIKRLRRELNYMKKQEKKKKKEKTGKKEKVNTCPECGNEGLVVKKYWHPSGKEKTLISCDYCGLRDITK